jgi:hypothetical protein
LWMAPFLAASVDRDLARLRACTELRQRPLPQAPSSLLLVCPAAASMVALHGHLLVALVACFHGVVTALWWEQRQRPAGSELLWLMDCTLDWCLVASKDRDLRAPSLWLSCCGMIWWPCDWEWPWHGRPTTRGVGGARALAASECLSVGYGPEAGGQRARGLVQCAPGPA